MFSPAPGYLIRPARTDDEDLEALRIIGHCLYSYPMAELKESRDRDSLANSWHLRCAKRPGETMLLTRKGLGDDEHTIVGATRITPDPAGDRDPDTDEIISWSITAILPDHRGKGLSKPLREAAIASTKKQVIKSRVEKDNPKSWRVAEKMGYQHERDDGKDRIYSLRITKQRKTAAEEVVSQVGLERRHLPTRTATAKQADFDRPRLLDPSIDAYRELGSVDAEEVEIQKEEAGDEPRIKQPPASPARPGDRDQRDMMQQMKTANDVIGMWLKSARDDDGDIDYEENPMLREERIRNRGDHDRPTEFGFDDEEVADTKRMLSVTEAGAKGGRYGDDIQEKAAMYDVPDELVKIGNARSFLDMDSLGGAAADYLSPGGWGGARAGRASMLARASGQEPGFNVRNPLTSDLLGSLAGGVGGAGLGAGIGKLIGDDEGVGTGAAIGGAAGSLAIPLLLRYLRRGEMREIGEGFDEAEEEGRVDRDVEPEEHGTFSNLLFPLSRSYRSGERAAFKKLRDGSEPTYTGADQVLNTLGHIPYANLLSMPAGALHNLAISSDVDREKRERRKADRQAALAGRGQLDEIEQLLAQLRQRKTAEDDMYDVPDDLIKFAMPREHTQGVPEKGVTRGQQVPDSGEPNYSSSEGPHAYTKTLIEAGGDVPDELVEDAADSA